jgi:hypothetical protein
MAKLHPIPTDLPEVRSVGATVLIRTVNDYWLGRIIQITGPYTLVIDNVSLVARMGRPHLFLANNFGQGETRAEIEVYPPKIRKEVQWLDVDDWPYPLPTVTQ